MKKGFTLFLFTFAYVASMVANDGIDKRIMKAKYYLSKKLTVQQLKALSFSDAVVHNKDSSIFYIKIPYKNQKKSGFTIVKSINGNMQHVSLDISNYQYGDSVLRQAATVVKVFDVNGHLYQIIHTDSRGGVIKITKANGRILPMDTIYKVVSFFIHLVNIITKDEKVFLNMNLLFDSIDSLNKKAMNDYMIPQDAISLSFQTGDAWEVEFDNSNLRPAINLKEAFKRFDSKPDSAKKQ